MIDLASVLIILAVTLVICCINYIVGKCQRDPRMVKLAETLPGPPRLPLVGNSMDFYFKRDTLKFMLEYHEKYGNTFRFWFGRYLAVMLSDIEDLEIVFMNSKMLGKPKIFEPFNVYFGDGLFVTQCISKWRKHRKILQPTFGRSTMHKYTSIVNEKTHLVADKMLHLVDGPEFDVWDFILNLTTNVTLKLTMNIDLDWSDESLLHYYEAVVKGLEVSSMQLCFPWLQHKLVNYLFFKKRSEQYQNEARKFIRKLIESKKHEIIREIEAHKNKNAAISEEIPPKSYMTLAYELAQSENDENIMIDELLVILSGGGDPGLVISFFLLAVAIHQDIQNKLYDELYEVFGESDRPADENDLDRLPYLEQVLKETLRRFPVATVILREAEEDVKLKDRAIPAGTILMLSVSGVHFNPEYYPDPWKFNPDNFLPEAVEKRHKLSLLAFSAGIRVCLGYNFAMFEMKLILIALLRKFSFFTKMKMEDIYMDGGIFMYPAKGYKFTIKSRIKKPTFLRK